MCERSELNFSGQNGRFPYLGCHSYPLLFFSPLSALLAFTEPHWKNSINHLPPHHGRPLAVSRKDVDQFPLRRCGQILKARLAGGQSITERKLLCLQLKNKKKKPTKTEVQENVPHSQPASEASGARFGKTPQTVTGSITIRQSSITTRTRMRTGNLQIPSPTEAY